MEAFTTNFEFLTAADGDRQLQLSIRIDDQRYFVAPFDETFGNLLLLCEGTPVSTHEDIPNGRISRKHSKKLARKVQEVSVSMRVYQKCLISEFRDPSPLVKWVIIASLRTQNHQWLQRALESFEILSRDQRIQIAEEASVVGWTALEKLPLDPIELVHGVIRAESRNKRAGTVSRVRKFLADANKAQLIELTQASVEFRQLHLLKLFLQHLKQVCGELYPSGDIHDHQVFENLVRSLNNSSPRKFLGDITQQRLCVDQILGLDINELLDICYWLNPSQTTSVNFRMLLRSFEGELILNPARLRSSLVPYLDTPKISRKALVEELLTKIPHSNLDLIQAAIELGDLDSFEILFPGRDPYVLMKMVHRKAPVELRWRMLHRLQKKFPNLDGYNDAVILQNSELMLWHSQWNPEQLRETSIDLGSSQMLNLAKCLGADTSDAEELLSPHLSPAVEPGLISTKSSSSIDIPWEKTSLNEIPWGEF